MRFQLKSQSIKLSENDVESACLDLLRLRGWWPIRQHAGLFKSADNRRWIRGVEKGSPDYAVMKAPSFFMETKRPGASLRPEQREKIAQLEEFYGLQTAVVEDVTELIDWLDRQRSP